MGKNASILLINKERGLTSFSSLNNIKRIIDPKVGHAGTLDKFAEGLLIVLTGSMTKLNVLFSQMDKQYRAEILFGTETDTLDPEGTVTGEAPVPSYETILKVIPSFLGEGEQEPPAYSALHINGKRASNLVRQGKQVVMKRRPITIHSFIPLQYNNGVLVADINVSKGTYIRSIARDLGKACGSRAHLSALMRTSIGPFSLTEAVDGSDAETLRFSMKHTDEYLRRVDAVTILEIPDDELFRVANGSFPRTVTCIKEGKNAIYGALYSKDGILRAVSDLQSKRLIAQIHPYIGRKSV
ncbi:MAG: tRNA pseudouridine(55) synthase TruB [Sphaerochaetaceae bacterium]